MAKGACAATVMLCLMLASGTFADIIPITSGISFQDEAQRVSQLELDNTSLLRSLDDTWAPGVVPELPSDVSPVPDYYATGTSPYYWDAIALRFDLSPIGWENVQSAELWFYLRQGTYSIADWHHYAIQQGYKNGTDEDASPSTATLATSFDTSGPLWVNDVVPVSWITGDSFDVTLRLWNAQIDAVELRCHPVPVPGAVLLGVLGLGSAGWHLRRRT